jgi:hypothetical protein
MKIGKLQVHRCPLSSQDLDFPSQPLCEADVRVERGKVEIVFRDQFASSRQKKVDMRECITRRVSSSLDLTVLGTSRTTYWGGGPACPSEQRYCRQISFGPWVLIE